MKKFLLLVTLLFVGMGLVACSDTEEVEYSDYTYLSLEMNPAVDFVLDAEEKVLTYRFRNEEAEVIAAGLDLVGKNYEEALHLYLNAAIETGYIDTDRNDNAVMIQAGGKEDSVNNQFMVQVQTKLQTFFQENAIGAVVLKNEEVDEEAKELVDTYEVTYGFAKMVLAYMEANEDAVLETVIEMEPKDLMTDFVAEANQYRDRYQNQIEAGAQAVKDELVEALQAKVQAHRQAVIDETATQPDMTGVKDDYLENFASLQAQYRSRNQTRLQTAKENVSENAPMYFSVDINPSVDFIIDGNGYVLTYMLKNEDAEVVGAGLQLEGLHYQEALRLYLNAAVQTGYIDVERADNAVMIQNAGINQELENAFMNQTQTMMQNFFYENAIGAVVMEKHEIDPEIQALAEEYEISYGFAKLVLAYLATDETLVLEDVLLLTSKEIIDLLGIECEAHMNQYRNQVEAGAQAIKDELVEALQSKVQNHFNAVENGQKSQPDISGLKQMYQADYENMHSQYVNRNQLRLQEAKANQSNKTE
jgi:hypothetical protein